MPPTDCMRAREAASARLDGELGELESARLDLHLQGCAACRAFAADIAALAGELRAGALEPAPAGLFVAQRRPRRRVAGPVAAAAATLLIAVAAGASFFMGELVGGHASGRAARTATAAETKLDPGLVAMLRGDVHPRARTGKVIAL